jgi:hypothetical protein
MAIGFAFSVFAGRAVLRTTGGFTRVVGLALAAVGCLLSVGTIAEPLWNSSVTIDKTYPFGTFMAVIAFCGLAALASVTSWYDRMVWPAEMRAWKKLWICMSCGTLFH